MNKPTVIVITGPTASGKSALAVKLAKLLETEIISADSRQIYQGIPIATAVPSLEERDGVKHHLMEILPLEAYYSASKFQEDTSTIVSHILKEKESVVICGGSMLYLDAFINGIDDLPTVPDELRTRLMQNWYKNGDNWLLQELKRLDSVYYNKIDHRNLKRVFHAVEISLTAGKPYTKLLTRNNQNSIISNHPFNIVKFCLNGSRESLFERINSRVIKMMEKGLEEEALKVYPMKHLNSLNTVGLKEMFAMFEGKFTKQEAIARLQKNTRVYAKKQLTWHKRDTNMLYLDFNDSAKENIQKILNNI